MQEQERRLRPAPHKATLPDIGTSMAVRRARQTVIDRDIARIRDITGDFTLPKAACTSWATLYAGLSDFIEDLMSHACLA